MLDKCHTMVTTLEAVIIRGLLLPVPVSGDTWHVAAGRMGCRLTCLTNNQRQEPAHRKHYFRHQTNRVNCQAKWEGGAGLQGQWSICCLLTVQIDIYTRYIYISDGLTLGRWKRQDQERQRRNILPECGGAPAAGRGSRPGLCQGAETGQQQHRAHTGDTIL